MHAFLSLSFSNFHKIEYSFMFCFECVCVYQMSLFRMPKSVARRLEKLQRDFLWGGRNLERKAHLVKWEVVCGNKEKGGLGIRKLTLLNKALLGKWIWRFACDKEALGSKCLWRSMDMRISVGGQKRLWVRLEWGFGRRF